MKFSTAASCSALGGVEDGERRAPRVSARFGPTVLRGGVRGLASVANEAATRATGSSSAPAKDNLPLAQKISMGTPVTGKKIRTGPVMASKNAKAERFKVSLRVVVCVCDRRGLWWDERPHDDDDERLTDPPLSTSLSLPAIRLSRTKRSSRSWATGAACSGPS